MTKLAPGGITAPLSTSAVSSRGRIVPPWVAATPVVLFAVPDPAADRFRSEEARGEERGKGDNPPAVVELFGLRLATPAAVPAAATPAVFFVAAGGEAGAAAAEGGFQVESALLLAVVALASTARFSLGPAAALSEAAIALVEAPDEQVRKASRAESGPPPPLDAFRLVPAALRDAAVGGAAAAASRFRLAAAAVDASP